MKEITEIRHRLLELITVHEGKLAVIEGIVTGTFTPIEVRALGVALYAEARSALQTKIPERIRICPLEARDARRLWWRLLAEESGNFDAGKDHSSLMAVTCRALGAEQDELDSMYERHSKSLEALRQEEPSIQATLRELTRMFIEESILARKSSSLGTALHEHYGVAEEALYYFQLHSVVDIEHSNAALDEIVRYATTHDLQKHVIDSAEDALSRFPIWLNP